MTSLSKLLSCKGGKRLEGNPICRDKNHPAFDLCTALKSKVVSFFFSFLLRLSAFPWVSVKKVGMLTTWDGVLVFYAFWIPTFWSNGTILPDRHFSLCSRWSSRLKSWHVLSERAASESDSCKGPNRQASKICAKPCLEQYARCAVPCCTPSLGSFKLSCVVPGFHSKSTYLRWLSIVSLMKAESPWAFSGVLITGNGNLMKKKGQPPESLSFFGFLSRSRRLPRSLLRLQHTTLQCCLTKTLQASKKQRVEWTWKLWRLVFRVFE